jgi:2Fe-2S ferredoxin
MPQITFKSVDGSSTTVDAKPGDSLMRVAIDHGIDGIAAECGGCLSCATCHAYIDESWIGRIPEPSEEEKVMVDCAIDVRPTSRLTCQIVVTEAMQGLVVEIPASQY